MKLVEGKLFDQERVKIMKEELVSYSVKRQEVVFLGINLSVLELLLQDLVASHLI